MTISAIHPLSGRRVFWWFAAFFGVIAAVNAGMVTLALRTHSGVVTEHAFEKGLNYNQTIADANAQAKLGWKIDVVWNHHQLRVTIHDAEGHLLSPSHVTAHISRPTQDQFDMDLILHPAGHHLWMATATPPLKGVWDIRLMIEHANDHYEHIDRLVIE